VDLKRDALYIEVKRWKADESMYQLVEMRKKGVLDGVKNLAVDSDIWQSSKPEHW
jgi:hypothetical protein